MTPGTLAAITSFTRHSGVTITPATLLLPNS